MIYNGREDGWKAKDFHKKCDRKGPTVSFIQIQDGPCIGGFTLCQWDSADIGFWQNDGSAMLFNLTDQLKFPCLESDNAIFCYHDYGPCFGGQNAELVAWQPFNEENNGGSISKQTVYDIGVDKQGKNKLTNQKSEYFTITEIEVWEVNGEYDNTPKASEK